LLKPIDFTNQIGNNVIQLDTPENNVNWESFIGNEYLDIGNFDIVGLIGAKTDTLTHNKKTQNQTTAISILTALNCDVSIGNLFNRYK
jgi:hypothetical protein